MASDRHGGAVAGRYEPRDARVRTLAWLLAALLAGMVVVLFLMKALFGHLASREERRPATPSTLAGARSNVPPEPRLQNTPLDDLRRLRSEEDAALSSYGWVDRAAGIVRIPIDRAIEITEKAAAAEPGAPDSGRPVPGGRR
jgi:hypothetical protein